jgi:hypothetical protein
VYKAAAAKAEKAEKNVPAANAKGGVMGSIPAADAVPPADLAIYIANRDRKRVEMYCWASVIFYIYMKILWCSRKMVAFNFGVDDCLSVNNPHSPT